jgi:plastocyanin
MPHRRAFLGAVATGGLALIAGCAGSGDEGAEPTTETDAATVSMTATQFDPRSVSVAVGATVTWANDADVEHTVTSASENWEFDETVPSGEETSHTFEEGGVYDVYCTIHGSVDLSGMSMKVAVGDATIEEPLTESGGSDDGGGGLY